MQHARRHVLDDLPRGLGDVDVLSVDVVPGASDEEGDMVREVKSSGDERQAEEEEEDGVCQSLVSQQFLEYVRRMGRGERGGAGVQNANFSQGVNI